MSHRVESQIGCVQPDSTRLSCELAVLKYGGSMQSHGGFTEANEAACGCTHTYVVLTCCCCLQVAGLYDVELLKAA
jgi:hypothetical protein